MAEKKSFRFSNDEKTVTIGGKTYSKASFKSQFAVVSQAGLKGVAEPKAGKSVKQVSAKTADEAKAKYNKKAAKKAASSIKAASKPVKTTAAAKAREAAKKRAAATAPSARSSGQKFTLRGGGAGGAFLENLK